MPSHPTAARIRGIANERVFIPQYRLSVGALTSTGSGQPLA
jgi:hypothetical protein